MLKEQGTDLFRAGKADVGEGRSFRGSVQCPEPSSPFLEPHLWHLHRTQNSAELTTQPALGTGPALEI